jgi:putative flippase GtrA
MSIAIYFIVGGISFLANFCTFIVLIKAFGLFWLFANVAGFLVGTWVNYVLSIKFVFESRIFSRRHHEVFLTVIVSVVGVLMESLLISLAHDRMNLSIVLSKIIAAGLVFFWNYGARRFLVFGAIKAIM